MIKSILWDFDGVIAESVNVKTEAFYDLFLPHGKDVAEKVVEHHMANGGVSRFEKFKIYYEKFLHTTISEQQLKELSDQFSNLVLSKVISSPYIPGVLEFIKGTQNAFNHYVISGTPNNEMKIIVEKRELSSYFKGVMGSPITKSEWINYLVKNNAIEIETTVFVGDATTDYQAAQSTGTKFILREVDYNQVYFKNYSGIRVKDFINFNKVIEVL